MQSFFSVDSCCIQEYSARPAGDMTRRRIMVPVIQREEQALAVQGLELQLYRRRRKELEKWETTMREDTKDQENAVKILNKNTVMSDTARDGRRELKRCRRNEQRRCRQQHKVEHLSSPQRVSSCEHKISSVKAEPGTIHASELGIGTRKIHLHQSKHETHGNDIGILTPPSSAPIEAACVQSHQRLQEAITAQRPHERVFQASAANTNRLADPIVLHSDSETFGHSQHNASPIYTKEDGVSSDQSCYDYLLEDLQTLPTWRVPEWQNSDDDLAVVRSDQETDAALQMRETLMAHYDDLLDHGYVLPSVIDFELLREIVASGSLVPESSLLVPVGTSGCHAMQRNIPVNTNTQLEAKPLAAEMPQPRPKRRCQKLLEAPPIAQPESSIRSRQPESRRSIDSYSEEDRSPTSKKRARPSGNTMTLRKAERWNEEEDWNLLLGMSKNWSSSVIRRRSDLAHRTESAVRSRRQLLKRKHPDLFDGEGRIEELI